MNISLHYSEKGDGDYLILLHGNGENSDYFVHQIASFSPFYHVMAIDTRGHGLSPRGTARFSLHQFADDLYRFMIEKSIPKAHILGFSDGGNIALTFVLKHPQMVDKLILNGANIHPTGIKRSVQFPVEIAYKIAHNFAEKNAKAAQNAELLSLMVNEPDIKIEELQQIHHSTLVIVGSNDMIKYSHSREIYENLPNAEFAVIKGNHFIAQKNYKDFNERVLQFLKK